MKNIEEEKREKKKKWQMLEGIFRVELLESFFLSSSFASFYLGRLTKNISLGKPMREIEAEATYGIRVIGSQCYYEQILLGPAELCRRLSGPTVPVTISSTTSTPAPVTLPTTKKKEESVWATLKALPILGQLLKDG